VRRAGGGSRTPRLEKLVVDVRIGFLFDLVSYCDVRVQSNPFITERDKRVLIERVMVRVLWWRSKIEWVITAY